MSSALDEIIGLAPPKARKPGLKIGANGDALSEIVSLAPPAKRRPRQSMSPVGPDSRLGRYIPERPDFTKPLPPETPVEAVSNPIEWALWAATGGPTNALLKLITSRLPWLAGAAARGAAQGGTQGILADVSEGRNPLPSVPANLAAGAVVGPVAEVIGTRLVRRAPRTPTSELPTVLEPTVTGAPEMPAVEGVMRTAPTVEPPTGLTPKAVPTQQPFTGKSAQQQAPGMSGTVESMKSDPEYLARLKELGGGRVVTNEETLAQALKAGPLEPAAIASVPANTPINPVEQTRALITEDFHQQRFLKALKSGDEAEADKALATIRYMKPGIENIRAVGGRTIQAQAMFVQDKVAGVYAELADMRAKGVPFEQMRKVADAKLAELSRAEQFSRAGATVTDWVRALETYATMAKLTSPVTHAVNTVSNALVYLTRPLGRIVKAGVQLTQKDVAGAEANLRYTFGTASGFKSGMQKYLTTLMGESPELGKATEAASRNFRFPKPLRPFDPFRQLSAADAFWKAIYSDAHISERAFASATREGLRGPARAARIAELMNKPPSSWVQEALEKAQEYTFQDAPDRFLQGVSKLRNFPGMRLVIPFIQTPYNIVKFQFQRSPVGILSPRNIKGLASGGEAQAEAIGRLAAGTGLALGGWMLVKNGEVTGEYPKDPGERALWDAEGRKAYSIRVGNKWVAYNRFQPVGMYLGQAVALEEAIKVGQEQGVGEAFSRLLATSAKQVTDLPFVSGLSSVLDALSDPARSAGKFMSNTATGLIPNILRDIRYQTDPVRREGRGLSFAVQNMTPGLSQNLPTKIDVLGREQRYDTNRLVRASKVIAGRTETPETEILRRSGASVVEPSPILRRFNRSVRLSGGDRERFEREMGEAARKAIAQVGKGDRLSSLTQEEQQDRIDRAVKLRRDAVRNRWKQRIKRSGDSDYPARR